MIADEVAHAEYAAARSSAIVVERTDRAFARIHGRDPVKMIQGLVTNDVSAASQERSVYAGMLTPKGRLLADMRVLRSGPDALIETDIHALQNVLDNVKKYVPPLFARAEDVSEQYTMFGVYGPQARGVVAAVADVPETIDGATTTNDGVICVRSSYIDEDGWEFIVRSQQARDFAERLAEVTHASLDTLEVLRIEAGTPRWGAELDENVIPLEAGLRERMISETKGCYTGQEVIVRILHRGHVNWMLRGVLMGDMHPAERGVPLLTAEAKQVGRITSSCISPRHGQTIALCYARRELGPPVSVRFGETGVDVRVVTLPFAEGGGRG